MRVTRPPQEPLLKRLAWLAWNKLWLLIALAWVVLIAWAMHGAMNAGGAPPDDMSAPAQTAPRQ